MGKQDIKYETVVGLEIHAQLLTNTKLFCGDSTTFGDDPNSNISPFTLAHPGTLPKMNRKAIEFAVKMGLACNSRIEKHNYFARKNYFYPDLPKGYQVSQHTTPICKGGFITIQSDNAEKKIHLNRIHLEEDAGKSLHDVYPDSSAVDFNRAGIPLIEIVTEPDVRSGEEAYAFITTIRKLVRYLGICDGNMEEGSLRCDANISVRKKGDIKLGTKVEVKNLNSIRNVKRAIEFESHRMIKLLENGEPISQQTRSFDAGKGTTFATRDKEEADDYRYFPEPDLTPFSLTEEFISEIKNSIPPLQDERSRNYQSLYRLSEYDALALTEEKDFADFYERVILHTKNYKAAANWMLGPVKSWLNENKKEIKDFPLDPSGIASLLNLVEEEKLSFSIASSKVLPQLLNNPEADPARIAEEKHLLQQTDHDSIEQTIQEIMIRFEDKVKEYRKGKKGLLGLFVGEVMKKTNADPKIVNELLIKKLKSS